MGLIKGIWYCCQVNKCCSVKPRQLRRPHVTPCLPFEQIHTRMGVCWLKYLMICLLSVLDTLTHPVLYPTLSPSLPLVVGQVLHAFSTRVWLVLVCQLCLDGPRQRFSCNHLRDWSSPINALISLAHTLKLTMLLWCCFLSRDCGGSGKRKSGKNQKSFYLCQ